MTFTLPGCGLYVGAKPTATTHAAGCSELIPDSWKDGVPGADLPQNNTAADWIVFGDQQTGRLDQANGRTVDTITILDRCEKRDAEAVRRARRGFFGRLLGL